VNLLADEDVNGLVVERLRQDDHVVLYIAEMKPGIADEEILRKANLTDWKGQKRRTAHDILTAQ
jgi:hypothetical protein